MATDEAAYVLAVYDSADDDRWRAIVMIGGLSAHRLLIPPDRFSGGIDGQQPSYS
jgi:hypothetical protein